MEKLKTIALVVIAVCAVVVTVKVVTAPVVGRYRMDKRLTIDTVTGKIWNPTGTEWTEFRGSIPK